MNRTQETRPAAPGFDAQPAARVLVVEDELKVAAALCEGLRGEQYAVSVEHTADGAFRRLNAQPFDVVLLDRKLPDGDGLDVLQAIRRRGAKTHVLLLTARDAVTDRVSGLDAGADDYLVKPFAFTELLARIRALLRRGSGGADVLSVGDLTLDRLTRKVSRDGRPIDLTVREFELLAHLMQHEGQVVSRETLGREVWTETARSTTLDNVIDVHIARLRRKIDMPGLPKLIETVRGIGFVVREEPL
jgi:DNA-binding response OmpR family regulator